MTSLSRSNKSFSLLGSWKSVDLVVAVDGYADPDVTGLVLVTPATDCTLAGCVRNDATEGVPAPLTISRCF